MNRDTFDPQTVKAVEIHSHMEDDSGVALMRQERLSYALVMTSSRETLARARKNKDLVGICWYADPKKKDHIDEAAKAFRDYPDIIKGIKLFPPQNYIVTVDLLSPIFEFVNKHNLLIEAHTEQHENDPDLYCNAAKYKPLMEKFPKTKLILLHGVPAEETFDVINSFENVYVDTSWKAWGREFAEKALKEVGAGKVMMGLDSPAGFAKKKDGTHLPHFRDAIRGIAEYYGKPEDVEKVLYKNAEKLLGFEVPQR
jgi:predicted TIM-barrel fold metal-dependent hydrolase